MQDKERLRKTIRVHYSKIARKDAGGCCGGGCSCNSASTEVKQASVKNGYSEADLSSVPPESNMGLGCGNPVAIAGLKEGETVLDLGCGGGFDCFLARERVGEAGYVIGVDMTPDMISLARRNARISGYTNVDFRLGEIEHLPVADASVDVIISNCVINLSLDKELVFKDAYRVLKPGGRLSVSDVVATVELSEQIKNEWIKQDPTLLSDCVAGAEYVENLMKMMADAGFKNITLTPKDNSREIVKSWSPDRRIEDYVASHIIEATKY